MVEDSSPEDASQLARRPPIAAYFGFVMKAGSLGPIGELVSLLSVGILDPSAFRAHARRHGVRGERWFKVQVLDLALGFIAEALRDGTLTQEEVAEIRALNAFLEITDGEYSEYRSAEVASLLGTQLQRILEDDEISGEEDLYQVELQAVFGLGYDDYLALTRRAFERAHLDLTHLAGHTGAAAANAKRKLVALTPVYRLATARRRSPGAMY